MRGGAIYWQSTYDCDIARLQNSRHMFKHLQNGSRPLMHGATHMGVRRYGCYKRGSRGRRGCTPRAQRCSPRVGARCMFNRIRIVSPIETDRSMKPTQLLTSGGTELAIWKERIDKGAWGGHGIHCRRGLIVSSQRMDQWSFARMSPTTTRQ